MRLAIISDEVAQDLSHVVRVIGENALAVTGIEIRSVWNIPPHQLSSDNITDIRRIIASTPYSIAGFCPPLFKAPLPINESDICSHRTALLHALEQARLLGAPHIRAFTFLSNGSPAPVHAGRLLREIFTDIPGDIPILIENGTRSNTPTLAHLARCLDAAGLDCLNVLWDPGNSVFGGWTGNPFPSDYETCHGRIRHVHAKDPLNQVAYVDLGSGVLPWRSIVERLLVDGFAGFLSVETHCRTNRVLSASERDDPWGDAFSYGGEQPSISALSFFQSIIRPRS